MQNAVVLIFATQVLLSIALPLEIVLPKDKRSEDISDLKSGVQLLFEYLVSTKYVIQHLVTRFICAG